MANLAIIPDYLAELILKMRAIQGQEEEVDSDSGSNPIDDNMADALQATGGDLTRAELVKEIAGLDEREQGELVALMWIGRGDAEPEEWEETVALAIERRDTPTPSYLLRHPLVADEIAEGAEKIGIELPLSDD